MKKNLLFALALGVGFGVNAQTSKVSSNLKSKAAPYIKKAVRGNEAASNLVKSPNHFTAAQNNKAANETTIGNTTYDLQTNSTVMNRIVNHGDGTISASWTYSSSGDISAADRGTGYNYYNGSSWGTAPSARQEANTRTGWNSLRSASGVESIINHSGSGGLHYLARATKGSGTWTEGTIPTNTGADMLWPRSVIGGNNGSTIHCIAITAPVANQGAIYQGMDGAILYYRSLNGGVTWDIVDSILPGLDSTDHIGFSADSYSIDARGDVIAIAIYNDLDDVILMKSTDNGNTWTQTIVHDFPITKYDPNAAGAISDANGDNVADTLESSDNSGAMIIDNNNQVHITYGYMRYLDDDPAASSNFSYFPFLDGLMYWNESMGANNPTLIAAAEDVDGDGQISFISTDVADMTTYNTSQTSLSSMGIDANNVIYVSYSGHKEDLDNAATQNYRHIYVMSTTDGGANWSCPRDVTPYPLHEFDECVFASMARTVDSKIHMVYQLDNEPGLAVRGDAGNNGDAGDAFIQNDIVYLTVDTGDVINYVCPAVSVNDIEEKVNNVTLFPNPSQHVVNLKFNLKQASNVVIAVTNIMGQEVISLNNATNNGQHKVELNVSDLTNGIYFVNIKVDDVVYTEKFVKQ